MMDWSIQLRYSDERGSGWMAWHSFHNWITRHFASFFKKIFTLFQESESAKDGELPRRKRLSLNELIWFLKFCEFGSNTISRYSLLGNILPVGDLRKIRKRWNLQRSGICLSFRKWAKWLGFEACGPWYSFEFNRGRHFVFRKFVLIFTIRWAFKAIKVQRRCFDSYRLLSFLWCRNCEIRDPSWKQWRRGRQSPSNCPLDP